MGLFSSIISAVGNAANDIFGGGNNSNDSNDPTKKKQNNTSVVNQKVNLPTPLKAPESTAQNHTPTFNIQPVDNSNLTATPAPAPHPSLFSSLLHDAGNVAHVVAAPVVGAANDVTHAVSSIPVIGKPLISADKGIALGAARAGEGAVTSTVGLPAAGNVAHVVAAPVVGAANDVTHAVSSIPVIGKPLISADKGIALGAARAGEGAVTSTVGLPAAAAHLGNFLASKATGQPETTNPFVTALTNATNDINAPVDNLAKATDQATHNIGQPGQDLYKPAQIAANIAAVVPGAAELATKLPVVGENVASTLSRIPGISVGRTAETAAGVDASGAAGRVPEEAPPTVPENAPPESGTKDPAEPAPTNAPSGETTKPISVTPNAPESGIKPTPQPSPATTTPGENITAPVTAPATPATVTPADAAAEQAAVQQTVDKTAEAVPKAEPAPEATAPNVTPTEAASQQVAEAPQQQVVNEAPNIEKTGNKEQDLQNSTALVQHLLENSRDFSGNDLQHTLDLANSHLNSNQVVSKILNSRLGEHLTDTEARNVRNAVESGNVTGLSDKEGAVYKAIQENVENPSNTVRTNLSKDYQAADNHFPQVRESSVKTAVKGASQAKGVNSKISTFNDLLNQNSRFSQGSSMGKFTDKAGKTVTGDAPDLGLTAKKDGTFVDKNGKVYNYSRATSQELENAGVKLQAPKDALAAYTRDTLNLKTRADAADYLVKNADDLGLSDSALAGKDTPVSIKSSDGENHTFFTDSKTAKDIKNSGILGDFSKDANLPTKAWNALSSLIAQGTVANPFAHGLNLATNAFVKGGVTATKDAFKGIDEAKELRMSDAGVHFPTYGKNSANALSKLTKGVSKLNERAISAIDTQTRAGMFDSLTSGKNAVSDKQAAKTINDWLGGRNVYNKEGAQLGIFWKYFVRQNVNAGRILSGAAKGDIKPLVNAALAGAATYEADKGLQAVTGNQGASTHAPGVVGIANDYLKAGKALVQSHYRDSANSLVNHINPLVTQLAEQTLGVDSFGNKFKNGTARAQNLATITPETNMLSSNGHALGEKALNTFGVYTPHIKGDMATNNPTLAPVLNVKNAQNGSTVAFPKDFTGEQETKAYDASLGKSGASYTTKGAASFANESQAQQQATTDATKALKPLGVTNASEIQAYSKLSSGDQKNYQTAAQQVLKAGNNVSSTSIQDQLIKNGHIDQAAAMDTGIPASLSSQDKETLETYARGGNKGQKAVWLQDNNNADNYYKAVINQKTATGSLTNEDKDTSGAWSGTGNTLAVKSLVAQTNKQFNVPQNIQQLYEDTTKTQYKNMTGAQKDALTQYAAQLNKNGVIDKFGIADGTSSGGGSKSAFKNAGIPTSGNAVVMPKATTGLTAGTVKYAAPTLAVAKPSASQGNNPFIRSISSSKGLK